MATPRKLRCQVIQLIDHGDRVYTIVLKPEQRIPRFSPGQFLHLALDEYDPSDFWPESRVFSIASSPTERECLRISYSVVGRFTTRMEQELKEGLWVWVKLPYGEFTIQGDRDVVLFAGGTGVTAFTAFIAGLGDEFSHRVYLFYGARYPELLIYKTLVDCVAQQFAQLQVTYFVERKNIDAAEVCMLSGYLSVEVAWPMICAPLDTDYYLSGPPAMLKSLAEKLCERNVAGKAIYTDAWA
ncbi:MAG TPA: FAD-dependent oxidoreductase [Chloroflexi bacterium]|nr:FAD-dependent oxidoreductase [Chloroflexota bacterium]